MSRSAAGFIRQHTSFYNDAVLHRGQAFFECMGWGDVLYPACLKWGQGGGGGDKEGPAGMTSTREEVIASCIMCRDMWIDWYMIC